MRRDGPPVRSVRVADDIRGGLFSFAIEAAVVAAGVVFSILIAVIALAVY